MAIHVGVMQLNEFIHDALWEGDFHIHSETDAVIACQFHPLESIVLDYKRNKLSRKAAQKLFKIALKSTDMEEVDYLDINDVLKDTTNKKMQDALSNLHESVYSFGHEDRWVIFTDLPLKDFGTSYNPFDYVDEDAGGENKIVIFDGFVYFIQTDNVVEGNRSGQHISSNGKPLPTYEISFLPEDAPNPENRGPAYGPPKHLMEHIADQIKREMKATGLAYIEVMREAGL